LIHFWNSPTAGGTILVRLKYNQVHKKGGAMKKRIWRVIHHLIILNFLVEIIYSFYMVFYVIGGGHWPLLRKAAQEPIEIILKRRLYAIEAWVAIGALCVYVALTIYLPQLLREMNHKSLETATENSLPAHEAVHDGQ
jgi:hypothetical protein